MRLDYEKDDAATPTCYLAVSDRVYDNGPHRYCTVIDYDYDQFKGHGENKVQFDLMRESLGYFL